MIKANFLEIDDLSWSSIVFFFLKKKEKKKKQQTIIIWHQDSMLTEFHGITKVSCWILVNVYCSKFGTWSIRLIQYWYPFNFFHVVNVYFLGKISILSTESSKIRISVGIF